MKEDHVVGRTADGTFQIGVNRTFPVTAAKLWSIITSPEFIAVLGSDAYPPIKKAPTSQSSVDDIATLDIASDDGITMRMTTFRPGSHYRMRWKLPEWESHSILQIRVTPKGEVPQSTLTFHQERLPDENTRLAMRDRWRTCSEVVEGYLGSRSALLLGDHGAGDD